MKKAGLGIVLYYPKPNRFAVNALLGALDMRPSLTDLPLLLPENESSLFQAVQTLSENGDRVLAGFSFFTSQISTIFPFVEKLRTKGHENIFLVSGGAHSTGDPEGCLAAGFDAAVMGEGEIPFPLLVERLADNTSWTDIPGLAWKGPEGGFHQNPRHAPVNLDDYLPFSPIRRKIGALEISRGCPFGCSFCQLQNLFGSRMRHRSVEAIARAVKVMALQPLTNIRFITPNAFAYGSPDGRTLNLPELVRMLEAVKSTAGPKVHLFLGSFPSEVRPEHVNAETLRILKTHASNKRLVIGAQTGSERMLKECRRGHTLEPVYNAVALCREFSITPIVDFIYGLPGETDDDLMDTVKVMRDFAKSGAVIRGHVFMPLPGTRFSKAGPGMVSDKLRKILEKEFLPKGSLFGHWEKQADYAKV